MYELKTAKEFDKPILCVKPYAYTGPVPLEILAADNQGGPVGLNAPSIIRKICAVLQWPVPFELRRGIPAQPAYATQEIARGLSSSVTERCSSARGQLIAGTARLGLSSWVLDNKKQ